MISRPRPTPSSTPASSPGGTNGRPLLVRVAWMAVGFVCVAVGAVGVVVPGLPTTVFFIGAAAAFARSSPRLEAWVLGLPGVGQAVADYRSGAGMPVRAKVVAVSMLVVAVSISIVLADPAWLRLLLAALGLVGVVVILRIKTKR